MNELDDRGILIKEVWEKIIADLPYGSTCKQCRLAILAAERDALLDLIQAWIDEADNINKRNHYGDGGQDGINYLHGQVAKLKTHLSVKKAKWDEADIAAKLRESMERDMGPF